jgi:hypothetical protein
VFFVIEENLPGYDEALCGDQNERSTGDKERFSLAE